MPGGPISTPTAVEDWDHSSYERLRLILDRLTPTSDGGFEGLIALVRAQLAGVRFKLAGSRRQFGYDGEGSVASAAIMFEAKRYTSRLLSKALQAKLKVWHDGDQRWPTALLARLTAE